MSITTTELMEGVKLHKIDTKKYKTNLLAIYLTSKLDRKHVTENALMLAILRRGTNKLKTQEDINIKLEELYGADFNCGIDKLCNDSVFKFYMESLNDEFLYEKENVLEQSTQMLFNIVFSPLTENGMFNKEYFNSEKENLRQIIRSRKDNKGAYAYSRCIEEMYKDEPYGLFTYGYEEDLDKITNKELYNAYLEMLKNSKIDIFVSGNFSEGNSNVDEIIMKQINEKNVQPRNIDVYVENEVKEPVEEKVVRETMDVSQGKLVIGLDVTKLESEDKAVASVYNAILGGGANSKLFQNVREKASLAYSAGSLYIKNKNSIVIRSGIEQKNYEKALEIIEKQIDDMKQGNFDETDMKNAKQLIVASFKSMEDEQDSTISYYFGKEMEQENADIATYISRIENVTKEQIVRVAQNVTINTIYFLSK